jgi:hypothetical protein
MPDTTALTLLGLSTGAGIYVSKKAVDVVADLVGKVLIPTAEAAGENLRDYLIAKRDRGVSVVMKASDYLDQKAVAPMPVPGRILWPLLTSASQEDDDAMRDVWAQLLANAADRAFSQNVLPAFVSILADLSPREAVLLNAVYLNETPGSSRIGVMVIDKSGKHRPFRIVAPTVDEAWRKRAVEAELEYEYEDFRILGGNLVRLGLCMAVPVGDSIRRSLSSPPEQFWLRLTPLGRAFVEACRRS